MTHHCEHNQIIVRHIQMRDGRPSLREFCADCGVKFMGMLPQRSDVDVQIKSYKYPNATLGEVPRDYLQWLVDGSKAPKTIKHAAQRILDGKPYTLKQDGDTYPKEEAMFVN